MLKESDPGPLAAGRPDQLRDKAGIRKVTGALPWTRCDLIDSPNSP